MKRVFKLALSLLVTVVFSWWAFHDTRWSELWASLRAANYAWVAAYFAILMGIHLCRTLRWGALLSGLEKVSFRPLNQASAIGFMLLIVLPFRLGEFARPYLIAQRSQIRKSAAMTTVVLERIVDGILVAGLLRVLLFWVPRDAPDYALVAFAGNAMFAIFAGGLAFLLFAAWQQRRAIAFVRGTLGLVSSQAADRAAGIVETFVGALRALPSPKQSAIFLFFTFGYWGLNGWGMSVLARAFACDAGPGCTPFPLSTFQGFMVMCVLVVGVMIPAAPGMVGTFQAAIKIGLALFLPLVTVTAKGVAYANVMWLSQTVAQVGLGLVVMASSHLSFSEIAGKLADEGASDSAAQAETAGG